MRGVTVTHKSISFFYEGGHCYTQKQNAFSLFLWGGGGVKGGGGEGVLSVGE